MERITLSSKTAADIPRLAREARVHGKPLLGDARLSTLPNQGQRAGHSGTKARNWGCGLMLERLGQHRTAVTPGLGARRTTSVCRDARFAR